MLGYSSSQIPKFRFWPSLRGQLSLFFSYIIKIKQQKYAGVVHIVVLFADPLYSYFCFQDNYLEEAIKMRNLLEEFHGKHGIRRPTILGVREHVFTGRFGVVSLKIQLLFYIFYCLSPYIMLNFLLQCFIIGVVYVQSRNQFCDSWSTCLSIST